MDASSAGKRGYGDREDESSTGRIWTAGFLHVTARSRFARVLKFMSRLFIFFKFSARGEPRITNWGY
jgi:hypothetical protein